MFKHFVAITRLNKPTGLLLLGCPVAWALWLASGGHPDPTLVAIFTLGVILMRSAGCVINDILDRRFDAKVQRTLHRPLAQQTMSLNSALCIFVLLLALSASLLYYLNHTCRILALIAAGMAIVYPLCKRFTYVPQLFLGLTFNMGVLMAFAQIQDTLPLSAWLLYGSAALWTFAYDTIYAMQDMQDDKALGLKSSALLLQHRVIAALYACYALAIGLFYGATYQSIKPIVTLYEAVILLIFMAILQTCHQKYHRAFNTNIMIGATLWGSIIMGLGAS